MGTFNVPHEQQVVEEILKAHPGLNVIVALMWPSVRGVIATVESDTAWRSVRAIGFDPDSLPFASPCLDSIVAQNTREMGYRAVQMIDGAAHGYPMPPLVKLEPMLIDRENLSSEPVQTLTRMDGGLQPLQSSGSAAP